MSTATAARPSRTRTSPARPPSGYPMGFYRYRNYILFALTAFPMLVFALELIWGVWALSQGADAWAGWLATLASPALLALNGLILVATLYFALRFGWVGRKIGAGRIGPIPGPPLPLFLLGLAPLGGFATLWLVTLLVIGGAFP